MAGEDKQNDETDDTTTDINDTNDNNAKDKKSKSVCFIAFRNNWLSSKLREETQEVQDIVEKARRNAGDAGAGRKAVSLAAIANAADEKERLTNAKTMKE